MGIENGDRDLSQAAAAKPSTHWNTFFNAMCCELSNSGPDYGFLFITLLPPFKYEAQKLLWSVSAARLPHPHVWRLRQRCAGRCPNFSHDLHRQTGMERGSAYMPHLTILKVPKRFPKVLNFLFSTTHQPTDP